MTASRPVPLVLSRPPLVKGAPIIGSLLPILRNPLETLYQAYAAYGPVFRLRALHREYVVLAGAEANRFVAGEGRDCFSVKAFLGEAVKQMGCPHMMLGADHEPHQIQRAAIAPIVGPNAFRDRIEELALPLLRLIEQWHDSPSIAVGPSMRQLISNQIGLNLQGVTTSYEEVQSLIYYFSAYSNVYALRKWPALMLLTPRFLSAKKTAKAHAREVMHHALSRSPEARNDRPLYLDTLLKAMDESGFPFTQGDREIHALLPFVLALDTVASTLVFMLERLVREPAWIPLLMSEVERGFSGGLPSAQALRELPALNGFARESLRLHPTAFGMGRTAVRDFDFAGFHVRAGESVVVFTTGDHRNDAYFPDPMRFDIHRYEAPRHEHRQMAYAPFGKGPHNCLGAGLTEILLPLNVGLILKHCRIESACDMRKVKMEFKPTPVLSDNFRVRLSPRHGVSIA